MKRATSFSKSGDVDPERQLLWYSVKAKIGVIGAYASGKTTYIRAVSDSFDSVSIKRYVEGIGYYNSTLAYDYGAFYVRKDCGGYRKIGRSEAAKLLDDGETVVRVIMWGSAGQKHLSEARKAIIYPRVDAVMLFFDLTRDDSIRLSLELYREARDEMPSLGYVKPVVFVFNKIDVVGLDAAKKVAEKVLRLIDEEFATWENTFFVSALKGVNLWDPLNRALTALLG